MEVLAVIDLVEIAREARENYDQKKSDTLPAWRVLQTPEAGSITVELLHHTLPLAVAMADMPSIRVLQSVLMWWWEMGRLYGRSEVVEETLNATKFD